MQGRVTLSGERVWKKSSEKGESPCGEEKWARRSLCAGKSVMALLAAMIARQVFCSTLPLWRPWQPQSRSSTQLIVPPTVVVLLWTSFSLRLLSQHCPLGSELLPFCASLLPPALFRPYVVIFSSKHSFGFSVSLFSPFAFPVHCGCCLPS